MNDDDKHDTAVKGSLSPAVVGAQLVPDYQQPHPQFYANYAVVSHTEHELTIAFGLLFEPYVVSESPEGPLVQVPIKLQVALPPSLIEGVIRALSIQLGRYRLENHKPKEEPNVSD